MFYPFDKMLQEFKMAAIDQLHHFLWVQTKPEIIRILQVMFFQGLTEM